MYIDITSLVTLIMFTYCFTDFICIYCILFFYILVNATPTLLILIFIYFFIPFFYFEICVYCCELLDTTALMELETQAFCYTHNNIC